MDADEGPDERAFDELVGSLDHAMVIVTTATDERRAGCLVGFHSQCSIEPRRYAVWISKLNETYRVARRAERFAVHVPRAEQHHLAELFGGETGDEIDKFTRCPWTPGPGGVPLLDECPDRFIGRRIELAEVGADHACLVLAPERTDRGDGSGAWFSFEAAKGIDAGHPPEGG